MTNKPTAILPMCAVCNKPVNSITRWESPSSACSQFEVECHGEREWSDIDWSTIQAATRISAGIAFQNKRICT